MTFNSLLMTLLLAPSCKAPQKCIEVKNGTFATSEGDNSSTIITRNGDKQIENSNNGAQISEFKVLWVDECTYLLFNRKVTKGVDLFPESNDDTLQVRITEVAEHYYLTQSQMLSTDLEMQQRVEIIR